jgi:hypothetical protein
MTLTSTPKVKFFVKGSTGQAVVWADGVKGGELTRLFVQHAQTGQRVDVVRS